MADEKAKQSDNKINVTIRLDADLHATIKKQADMDERPISQFLERHVRKSFTPSHKQEVSA